MTFNSEGHAITFRHGGWLPLRRRVQAAFVRLSVGLGRRMRFMECGSTYHILSSIAEPVRYKLAANACHDRFCLPCCNERSRIVARNVNVALAGKPARFITLTLRSTTESLSELIERLYASFKMLRQNPLWRRTQKGGVAFLELKWSERSARWHPHFHVLSHGKYIDQAKLCNVWKVVTGGSWIVDVRLVRNDGEAVAYCTKYASKPFDRDLLKNDARLEEAILALEGRRMILTYGDWKGVRVTARPDKEAWASVGTVAELAHKAVDGDKEAMQVLLTVLGDSSIAFLQHAQNTLFYVPTKSIDWPDLYWVIPTENVPS